MGLFVAAMRGQGLGREITRLVLAWAFDVRGVHRGEIQLSDNAAAREVLEGLSQIQGLMEKLGKLNVGPKDAAEIQVSAAEFVLEGLHAHKKIGRNEERVFTAGEKPPKKQERVFEPDDSEFGRKRGFN